MRAKVWNCRFIRKYLLRPNLRMRQNCSRAMSTAHHSDFHCEIEGEALHRYKPGGYHPIHLGDTLDGGRYTIHHKLGWGGYGTSWLALDKRSVVNSILLLDVSGLTEVSKLRALRSNQSECLRAFRFSGGRDSSSLGEMFIFSRKNGHR